MELHGQNDSRHRRLRIDRLDDHRPIAGDVQPKQIVVIDNLSRGTLLNLEQALASGRVELVREDIRYFDRIRPLSTASTRSSTRRPSASPAAPQEPRECLEVLIDGTFNVLQACVEAGVKRLVAASSASVYGMADEFPTSEKHHLYNNRTLYGAAKVANEGMLRSLQRHVRTDVRRLALFQRLRPADGHLRQVYRGADSLAGLPRSRRAPEDLRRRTSRRWISSMSRTWPRANLLAMQSDVSDEVFNVASGDETSLLGLLRALLAGHGHRACAAGVPARAGGQSRAAAAGRHRQGGATARLPRRRSRWKRDFAGSSPGGEEVIARGQQADYEGRRRSRDESIMIPITKPYLGPRGGRGGAAGRRKRLGYAGPQGRRVRASRGRLLRRGRRRGRLELHHRAAPGAAGPGHRAGRRGDLPLDVVHRHGQLDPLHGRDARLRRRRSARPTTSIPTRSRRRSRPAPRRSWSSTRSACPSTSTASWRSAARHGVKIVEDAACAIGSRYKGRPIGGAQRNGLLQLPSPQGHHHRRRRHDHHEQRRATPRGCGCCASTA